LDDDLVKNVINYFDNNDITYRYVLDNGVGYLNRHDEDKEMLFYRLYNMIPEVKKYEGERIIHLLYYSDDVQHREIVKLATNAENCYMGLASEISPKDRSKGTGMYDVMNDYGFKKDEVCAFGDGGNDIEMLKMAGLGIAMGNGRQECKDAADYIADDISKDGLYKAIKHFGFLKG